MGVVAGSTLREREVRPGGKEQCRNVVKPVTRSQRQTHTSGASRVVSGGLGYLYSHFHNHWWGCLCRMFTPQPSGLRELTPSHTGRCWLWAQVRVRDRAKVKAESRAPKVSATNR